MHFERAFRKARAGPEGPALLLVAGPIRNRAMGAAQVQAAYKMRADGSAISRASSLRPIAISTQATGFAACSAFSNLRLRYHPSPRLIAASLNCCHG